MALLTSGLEDQCLPSCSLFWVVVVDSHPFDKCGVCSRVSGFDMGDGTTFSDYLQVHACRSGSWVEVINDLLLSLPFIRWVLSLRVCSTILEFQIDATCLGCLFRFPGREKRI